jgi:hypothetical protein
MVQGRQARTMKIQNPPSPPFRKGGLGGFERYFLGKSLETWIFPENFLKEMVDLETNIVLNNRAKRKNLIIPDSIR